MPGPFVLFALGALGTLLSPLLFLGNFVPATFGNFVPPSAFGDFDTFFVDPSPFGNLVPPSFNPSSFGDFDTFFVDPSTFGNFVLPSFNPSAFGDLDPTFADPGAFVSDPSPPFAEPFPVIFGDLVPFPTCVLLGLPRVIHFTMVSAFSAFFKCIF